MPEMANADGLEETKPTVAEPVQRTKQENRERVNEFQAGKRRERWRKQNRIARQSRKQQRRK